MPTILRNGPYRFYFWSHELNELPHVHVDRDDCSAKFWLEPVSLARNIGFRPLDRMSFERFIAWLKSTFLTFWRLGMGTLALAADERVAGVEFADDVLSVALKDGRTISVPLTWYPRLLKATPAQRLNWKIAGGGYGIHWPDIDEDLNTEGLLRGAPAPRPRPAAAKSKKKARPGA